MKVCGIDIAGGEARFVMLDGGIDSYILIDCPTKKLPLENSASSEDVKSFKSSVDALLRDYEIDKVGIKKRAEKGTFAGGAKSFKIEALIQLANCAVIIVPPQTISARLKKNPQAFPTSLHQYQKDAFQTAYAILHNG